MSSSDKSLPAPAPVAAPSYRALAEPAATPLPRPGWRMAAFFVAAFAFLLASFPARNSDIWRHLAAGRQVTQGGFRVGPDSFDPTAPRSGSTWLYDLLSYLVYSAAGGVGLVLVKALLVV